MQGGFLDHQNVSSSAPALLLLCLQLPGTHGIGATAVSWAPALQPGALISAKAPAAPVKRLVSCGCDNTIRVGQCCRRHTQGTLNAVDVGSRQPGHASAVASGSGLHVCLPADLALWGSWAMAGGGGIAWAL
jgi:hypothetical protein